jgi:hypothetical protein
MLPIQLSTIATVSILFVLLLLRSSDVRVEPVLDFLNPVANRTPLTLIRNTTFVYHVQPIKKPAVGPVGIIVHAVDDNRHVARHMRAVIHVRFGGVHLSLGQQQPSGVDPLGEGPMRVQRVVVDETPPVGRVGLLDVNDQEVGKCGASGGQSTQAVELGHERRSGTAAEADDERPDAALVVEQAAWRTVDGEQVRIVRRTTGDDGLANVEYHAAEARAPRIHRYQALLSFCQVTNSYTVNVLRRNTCWK